MKYQIICDKTNNSSQDIVVGKVNVTVKFSPPNKTFRQWLRTDDPTDHYGIFEAQLSYYTQEHSIDKVKELALKTAEKFPEQITILQEVIAKHFPQYKELTDKIIMLQ